MTFASLPCILLLIAPSLDQPKSFADLDTVVDRARSTFDVPGIAVGVVKDGKLVFAKGYGIRKLGDPAPVTPDTLFGIASNSKAFSAAALAILVDEKKIRWDDHVIDVMPNFQMYDPYVSREMRIRDLLCHRSGLGLGAGDLMFFPTTDLSREEIYRRLRFIRPATSFRSKYGYSNLMFLAAGQIIPAKTGRTWEQYIDERILKRLGMNSSNTSVKQFKPGQDIVMPHAKENGKLVSLPHEPLDNCAAAGAINSSINDMSKWVTVQLDRGAMKEGRLFSKQQADEMWSAHTPIPIASPPDAPPGTTPNFSAYGLGWVLSDYRGKKLVGHTGGLAGMVTRVTLVPELKLGVMVFTNQEEGAAFNSVSNTILDMYLTSEKVDWVKLYADRTKKRDADAAATIAKAGAKRNAESKPSLPLKSYAGRLRDAWYGDVLIEEKEGRLSIRFTHSPELTGDLEHWQYDTFIARWKKRSLLADAYVTFSLGHDGAIAEAKMAAVSPLTDFSYDFHDLLLKPAPKDGPAK